MVSTHAPGEELTIVSWALGDICENHTTLTVDHGLRPVTMHGAVNASGAPLVSNGHLGADVIRLEAGAGFAPHTHPGDHILIVTAGEGTITYAGRVYKTSAGNAYLIAGAVPHAVGAITDHVLIAVGAPHRSVDALDRMDVVAYREVISPIGDLECTICQLAAGVPQRLHDVACPHCPCHTCVGVAS